MINTSIQNLDFNYTKNRYLFKDLSLDLPAGRICGLLGKNGAGKTTLFKLLSGLTFRKKGVVRSMGHDPQKRNPQFLSNVYFLPEEFDVPQMSVRKYVALHAPFYPSFDHSLMIKTLQEFELEDSAKLNKLSYGQKKKVLIGFALASGCQILLLDEPTNGLDIPSKSIFRKLVASSMREDQTILISTHQVRDLDSLIDQVIILKDGRIIFNQDTESISNKYIFKHLPAKTNLPDTIYEEEGLHHYAVIAHNAADDSSKIDFELLFNGIIAYPERFPNI